MCQRIKSPGHSGHMRRSRMRSWRRRATRRLVSDASQTQTVHINNIQNGKAFQEHFVGFLCRVSNQIFMHLKKKKIFWP